jgi:hypothetical protein
MNWGGKFLLSGRKDDVLRGAGCGPKVPEAVVGVEEGRYGALELVLGVVGVVVDGVAPGVVVLAIVVAIGNIFIVPGMRSSRGLLKVPHAPAYRCLLHRLPRRSCPVVNGAPTGGALLLEGGTVTCDATLSRSRG